MQKKDIKIKVLIGLMGLTVLALLLVQAFWFSKAYDTRESQFAQTANLALRDVADEFLRMQHDDSSRIPPIEQRANNAFFVALNRPAKVEVIDSLLRSLLPRHGIDLDFHYALLEPQNAQIQLGNFVQLDSVSAAPPSCAGRAEDGQPADLLVTFSDMGGHVLGSMGIWIFSSIALVAVLLIFAGLLVFLIREKRLSQLKKHFTHNLTHELNTPITNISIASEVLMSPRSQSDPRRQQVYADIIHKETQRLKSLVSRVLQISSLESEKLTLHKQEVDLNALVREVIHVVTPRIETRAGSIDCELSAQSATIWADRHHLLNTLYNLIDNADKYSPESPRIHIRTYNDQGGVHIEVQDQGKGVSPEKQKLIFDKFYRAEEGDVQNERGFGLGLSYVQLILKAHRGKIGIRSQPGLGSCFTIFLPFNTGL